MGLCSLLSDASYAMSRACGPVAGPVHLNLVLREPLDPSIQPWPHELLSGSARLTCGSHRASRSPTIFPRTAGCRCRPTPRYSRSLCRSALRAEGGARWRAVHQRAAGCNLLGQAPGWPLLSDDAQAAAGGGRHRGRPCAPERPIAVGRRGAGQGDRPGRGASGRRAHSLQAAPALAASSSSIHVMFEEHDERSDPEHTATHRVEGDIAAVSQPRARPQGRRARQTLSWHSAPPPPKQSARSQTHSPSRRPNPWSSL